jgi:hypothetical protein
LRIYAEAALRAVAYVVETARNGESQNAVWSANNVAEAVSDFIRRGGYDFGKGPTVGTRFYSHPVTKWEMDYQWQELAALEARTPSLIS